MVSFPWFLFNLTTALAWIPRVWVAHLELYNPRGCHRASKPDAEPGFPVTSLPHSVPGNHNVQTASVIWFQPVLFSSSFENKNPLLKMMTESYKCQLAKFVNYIEVSLPIVIGLGTCLFHRIHAYKFILSSWLLDTSLVVIFRSCVLFFFLLNSLGEYPHLVSSGYKQAETATVFTPNFTIVFCKHNYICILKGLPWFTKSQSIQGLGTRRNLASLSQWVHTLVGDKGPPKKGCNFLKDL